jgi:polysaccharide biosynthesis transport protein
MPEFTGHRDIRSYIRTIWRWKLLIAVFVIGAPVVAYVVEKGKPKQYTSNALVNVSQETVNSSLLSGSASFSTNNIQAIAALITTTPVADVAGRLLRPAESAADAVSGVSASANSETDFITITAVKSRPSLAADAANAFAKALDVNQVRSAKTEIQQAIASTQAQLTHLSKSNTEYQSLEAQLTQLRAALSDQAGDVTVLDAAVPDPTPTGPHPKRGIELGLVIGILLAVAAVMLLDSADRRLRSPDDLETLTKLPVLASFGPSAFQVQLETAPADEEAFQTLRTSLTYFTVDQRIKSVLVSSPGEQEGKSTIAVRLALACARAGLNVILLDADLRRAGATSKLGLRPSVPLASILADRRPVETGLIEWPLDADDAGRLRVVAAGPAPPNPAALVSSEIMRGLIATLEDRSDLVIIDTPAGLAVSDGVPLMQHVSGVVLVARMNRSTRDTVRRLQKIIESAHGNLLGAVATGVSNGPGYEKYSQEYYSTTTRGRGRGFRLRKMASQPEPSQPEPARVPENRF